MPPDPIKKFIELFSVLPGIGPRQARRLAFHLVNQGRSLIDELAKSVHGLGALANCAECFRVSQLDREGRCPICGNTNRRKDIIAIVEKDTDLMSLEQTKKFNGTYLILGELEKDGLLNSQQKLRLNSLKSRLQKLSGGQAEEILLALDPTSYGDMHAALIKDELKSFAKKITRLGRGLPTGGEVEFADEETLGGALDNRI